MKRVIWELS